LCSPSHAQDQTSSKLLHGQAIWVGHDGTLRPHATAISKLTEVYLRPKEPPVQSSTRCSNRTTYIMSQEGRPRKAKHGTLTKHVSPLPSSTPPEGPHKAVFISQHPRPHRGNLRSGYPPHTGRRYGKHQYARNTTARYTQGRWSTRTGHTNYHQLITHSNLDIRKAERGKGCNSTTSYAAPTTQQAVGRPPTHK
jgi:hypothetical protein